MKRLLLPPDELTTGIALIVCRRRKRSMSLAGSAHRFVMEVVTAHLPMVMKMELLRAGATFSSS